MSSSGGPSAGRSGRQRRDNTKQHNGSAAAGSGSGSGSGSGAERPSKPATSAKQVRRGSRRLAQDGVWGIGGA